jgi:hypothetical protein
MKRDNETACAVSDGILKIVGEGYEYVGKDRKVGGYCYVFRKGRCSITIYEYFADNRQVKWTDAVGGGVYVIAHRGTDRKRKTWGVNRDANFCVTKSESLRGIDLAVAYNKRKKKK